MTFSHFLRIVEIRTKIVSVSSLLIGTAFVFYSRIPFDPTAFVLLVISVLAIDMGTTAFNTFFDYLSGVDHPALNRERDKVLVHDGVAPGVALVVSIILYGIGGVVGLFLAARVGWFLVPVGMASMAVGFFYNAGPLPISRTPFGELFAGGFLGWVLVELSIYIHTPAMSGFLWWAGVPSALMIASILTVNNTCDMEGDRKSGRRTLSIVIGRTAGELLVYAEGIGSIIVLAALFAPRISGGGVDFRVMIPVLVAGAVPAGLEYRRMHRRGYSHATKGPSMGSISRVFTAFTGAVLVLLAAGFVQNA